MINISASGNFHCQLGKSNANGAQEPISEETPSAQASPIPTNTKQPVTATNSPSDWGVIEECDEKSVSYNFICVICCQKCLYLGTAVKSFQRFKHYHTTGNYCAPHKSIRINVQRRTKIMQQTRCVLYFSMINN